MLRPKFLATAALSACAFNVGANADTIHVPADHPTIQAAIDAATDGDVVLVGDGTYAGAGNTEISFAGKAITVRSENGAQQCVINGEGAGRGFVFGTSEGTDSVLEGFSIVNGLGTPDGGAIFIAGCSPTILDCRFIGNEATNGGAVYCSPISNPVLTDCVFEKNHATWSGGAIYSHYSSPTITNCTFSGSTADNLGGAIRNEISTPTVTGCTFASNSAGFGGGAIMNKSSGGAITDCRFIGNTTPNWGGGVYNLDGSSPTVTNCEFFANQADFGGGMNNHNISEPLVVNCLFAGNTAVRGAGMLNHSDGNPNVINCTFADNAAVQFGGAICHMNNGSGWGIPTVANCVLWGNTPQQIAIISSPQMVVQHSDVEGGWAGQGNVSGDPLFVDADGPDNDPATFADNDYRLSSGSPAIDAGNNAQVPAQIATDLDGNARFVDDPDTADSGLGTPPLVDIGAFEYQPVPLGDITGDGAVDIDDLFEVIAAWGDCPAPPATCLADLDQSGAVDIDDLFLVIGNWS